jgi:chromosome segregation ATPase
MEAMREAWTDDRLDDLANRMDRGFDRVDADIRELRTETKSEFALLRGEICERFDKIEGQFGSRFDQLKAETDGRFDKVDERFDKVDKRFDKVDEKFERIDLRLDSIQRTIAMGAIAMSGAFIAGFAALVGIIAAGV